MATPDPFWDKLLGSVLRVEAAPIVKSEVLAPLGEDDFWNQMVKPEVPPGHRLAEMDNAQLTRLQETCARWSLLRHVAASMVS